jgi:hypothetical protein
MSIETRFDIPFVTGLALREQQMQQNYRVPPQILIRTNSLVVSLVWR